MSLKVSKQAVQTDVLPVKRFDYSHRSQSSLNFGELSIATSFEMIPNSKVDFDFAQIVRASTMVSPTFGKMSHDAWGVFVPYRSVLPWFAQLMTDTAHAQGIFDTDKRYTSSILQHKDVPQIMVKQLTALCCIGAEVVMYRRPIKLKSDPDHPGKVLFGDVSNALIPMHPNMTDGDGMLWGDLSDQEHEDWRYYWPSSHTGSEFVFGSGSTGGRSRQRWMNVKNTTEVLPFWDNYVGNYFNINYFFTDRCSPNGGMSDFQNNAAYFAVPLGHYDVQIVPESCDFLLPLVGNATKWANSGDRNIPDFNSVSDFDYVIGFRMSGAGKRVYKLLRGLGYDLNLASEEKVSILPLLCAMRAYWDLFGVVRTRNFEESNLHALITTLQTSYRDDVFLHGYSFPDSAPNYANLWDVNSNSGTVWWSCVKDLFNFFVTDDTDFVSSHLQSAFYDSPLSGKTTVSDVILNSSAGWFDAYGVDFGNGSGNFPIASIETIRHTALSEALLKIMFKFTNRYSELGQAIASRLRADGHGLYVDNMPVDFVGHTSLDLNVSDVNATADSTNEVGNSFVGDVAGKSVSGGKSKHWNYRANEFGMFIVFDSIVPHSDFVQITGAWTRERSRFDFHSASFDSVDYQQSTKGSLFGYPQIMEPKTQSQMKGFGFIPRHFDKKFRPSILNGEFAFPSTDSALLPFSLQKVLPINRLMTKDLGEVDGSTAHFFTYQETLNYDNLPIAGDVWRYVYRAGWQGMLNRIFVNTDPIDKTFIGYVSDTETGYLSEKVFYCSPMRDNWYVDMLFTCNYFAPMKPVIDSSLDLTGEEKRGTPMKQQ